MPKLLFSQRFIVPVYRGSGRHLLPTFAGDAAQSESFSHHSFSHGVHLCAATVALRYCIGESEGVEEEILKIKLEVKEMPSREVMGSANQFLKCLGQNSFV